MTVTVVDNKCGTSLRVISLQRPSSRAFCTSARKINSQLTGATMDRPPFCAAFNMVLFLFTREGELSTLLFTLAVSFIQSSLIAESLVELFHSPGRALVKLRCEALKLPLEPERRRRDELLLWLALLFPLLFALLSPAPPEERIVGVTLELRLRGPRPCGVVDSGENCCSVLVSKSSVLLKYSLLKLSKLEAEALAALLGPLIAVLAMVFGLVATASFK